MRRLRRLFVVCCVWLLPLVIAAHAFAHERWAMVASSVVVLLVNLALHCRRRWPLRFPHREREPLRIPTVRR